MRKVTTRRNDHVIVDAWESITKAMQGQQNQVGDEFHGLGKFQRNKSLTFKGICDPEGARAWLREIEKIF